MKHRNKIIRSFLTRIFFFYFSTKSSEKLFDSHDQSISQKYKKNNIHSFNNIQAKNLQNTKILIYPILFYTTQQEFDSHDKPISPKYKKNNIFSFNNIQTKNFQNTKILIHPIEAARTEPLDR